jgi:hypothetical protein
MRLMLIRVTAYIITSLLFFVAIDNTFMIDVYKFAGDCCR